MKKLFKISNFAGVKAKLYIFNPENDMALACGVEGYNVPGWAKRLRRDLEVLPAYYAESGSKLLVEDAVGVQRWLDERGLGVEAVEASQLRLLRDVEVVPWGWSEWLCKRLTLAGLRRSELPDEASMSKVGQLAHRRTSIAIHRAIAREMGREFSPVPVEIDKARAVLEWAREHRGCYVKTPWSGSGRGIYHVTDADSPEFSRWCSGAIARQGSLLCEEGLERVLDFALEFKCDGGCEFEGYSVFTSDGHNQYGRGIVESQESLRGIIAAQYPGIDRLTEAMTRVVEGMVAPYYKGYLGVDMLLYRTADGGIDVDPCVELNLRCTMGLVTCALGERHKLRGRFGIIPVAELTGGYRVLSPILPGTRHVAVIE